MSTPDRKLPRVTAIPAARSSAAVLRVRLFVVLGLLLAAAAAGILAAIAWFTQKPAVVDISAAQPKAEAMASLVANAFLNGVAAPIPVTQGVEPWKVSGSLPHEEPHWTGFDTGTLSTGLYMERHRFLFYRLLPPAEGSTDPVRQLNELFIPLVLSNAETPALGGLPYFHPIAYGNVSGSTLYDTKTDAPKAVTDAVTAWGNAWAAGDAAALKKLAGDGTDGAYYPGLGGCKALGTSILSTKPVSQNSWVVRARVSLECANGYRQSMDLDVTLQGAAPNPTYVVGWGAVGSGVLARDDVRTLTK